MSSQFEKIIFIDRDGVINEDPIGDYIKRWEDFRFITGALTALRRLAETGFRIVIVSNQAGIGDGAYPEAALKEITKNMLEHLKREGIRVRSIYYCLHGKQAGCDCRKPKTGLFVKAEQDISFDREQTFFIGDKTSDIEAGKAFGLRTILVLTGHGKSDLGKLRKDLEPEQISPSIVEAVLYVLEHAKKNSS
jgi:D-glycero-D-manno-heptose 1,7-bisphosphate phosphatase